MKDYKAHLEQKGKLPSQREVERFVKDNAAIADSKRGWN